MSHPFLAIPSFIHIYPETGAGQVNSGEIADYVRSLVRAAVDIRPEFVSCALSSCTGEEREGILNKTARNMARLKVRDVTKKDVRVDPLKLEIDYERRNLAKSTGRTCGVIYEGFNLQQLYCNFIDPQERNLHHLHLVVTNQLFATWDTNNHRYHARVSIYGLPTLLSTSGVVEAPAKPRDYYLRRHLGEDLHELKEHFKEECIDYQDPRLTDVLKGYAAQALFYYLLGYPFCEDSNCRLFNAHRQSELLQAQLFSPYEFCSRHQAVLDQLQELFG
jgi:hypothetical protein